MPMLDNLFAFSWDPQVAITLQPLSLAIWAARWPVPPAAAVTSTVSPAFTSPLNCTLTYDPLPQQGLQDLYLAFYRSPSRKPSDTGRFKPYSSRPKEVLMTQCFSAVLCDYA